MELLTSVIYLQHADESYKNVSHLYTQQNMVYSTYTASHYR